MRSPRESTITADTDDAQPAKRRTSVQSTSYDWSSSTIRSAAASSPTRAASIARPPSSAMDTAAVAAGPPPTVSKRVARCFRACCGNSGTVNTKSCTAWPTHSTVGICVPVRKG